MTLQKWVIFIMGVYGENLCLLSDQAELLFLVIQKTLTHTMKVLARKKQVIKKLSQKSLWQTYMKWTVVWIPSCFFYTKYIYCHSNSDPTTASCLFDERLVLVCESWHRCLLYHVKTTRNLASSDVLSTTSFSSTIWPNNAIIALSASSLHARARLASAAIKSRGYLGESVDPGFPFWLFPQRHHEELNKHEPCIFSFVCWTCRLGCNQRRYTWVLQHCYSLCFQIYSILFLRYLKSWVTR